MPSILTCWVVGCHYYNGVAGVSSGQQLALCREKNNSHDPNAIAVYTLSGGMLGHLSRSDAANLAAPLDQGTRVTVRVEEVTQKPARLRVSVAMETTITAPSEPLPYRPKPIPTTSQSPISIPTTIPSPSPPAPSQKPQRTTRSESNIPAWAWGLVALFILWLLMRK